MLSTLSLASWEGLQRIVYCILPGQGALAPQYFSQIIMGYTQNNMHNGITWGHQIGSRNPNLTFRQWWFLSKHTQHWYCLFWSKIRNSRYRAHMECSQFLKTFAHKCLWNSHISEAKRVSPQRVCLFGSTLVEKSATGTKRSRGDD